MTIRIIVPVNALHSCSHWRLPQVAKDIRSSVEATTFKSSHTKTATTVYTHVYLMQALRSQWGSPLEPVSYIIVLRRNPHYTRTVQTFRTCRALTSVLAAIMSATDDCHVLYYSYMTSFNLQCLTWDWYCPSCCLLYILKHPIHPVPMVGLRTVRNRWRESENGDQRIYL